MPSASSRSAQEASGARRFDKRPSRRRLPLLGACFRLGSRDTSAVRHCASDMLQFGAAASTSMVKGGTRPLHLLVLAALATATAAATGALGHGSDSRHAHLLEADVE